MGILAGRSQSIKLFSILLWLILFLSAGSIVLLEQADHRHGLAGNVAFTYLDDNTLSGGVTVPPLQGFLWIPRTGDYEFSVQTDGGMSISLDGEVILQETTHSEIHTLTETLELQKGIYPLEIAYDVLPDNPSRSLLDLRWKKPGAFFSTRVPFWALLQQQENAFGRLKLYQLLWIGTRRLLWGAVCGLVVAAGLRVKAGELDWRQALGLALLFAITFGMAALFLWQRMAHDPSLLVLPLGYDQYAYEVNSQQLMQGTWPPHNQPFFFQPGLTYATYFFHLLAGPDIFSIRLLVAGLTALIPLLVFSTTNLIFDDHRIGWIAAVLAAVYPPFAFYASTGLTAPVATILSALLLWRLAHFIRYWLWQDVLLAGVIFGGLVVARPNQLLYLPFLLPVLVWMFSERRKELIVKGGLMLIVAALVIAPVSLHNRRAGSTALVSTSGPLILYLSNNRDATGYYVYLQAVEEARANHISYQEALASDIKADPVRWIQLMLRKTGMFWSKYEIIDNVGYATNGTEVSSLLRFLQPYGFGVVALLSLNGVILALLKKKPLAWMLYIFIVVNMVTTIAFYPLGRIRLPMLVSLFPLAGFWLVAVFDEVYPALQNQALLRSGGILVGVGVLLFSLSAAYNYLPLPRLYQESRLPEGIVPVDKVFDGRIRLAGYHIAAGEENIQPEGTLLVTLYWQRLEPIDTDYGVSLALRGWDQQVYAQRSQTVGMVSFQYYPMSKWQDDRIFEEEYLLLVGDNIPVPLAADIWIALADGEQRLTYNDAGETTFPIATVRLAETPQVSAQKPAISTAYHFGTEIILDGFTFEPQENLIDLTLYWSVAGMLPPGNYQTFIHLFDRSGQLVAQEDGAPLGELFPYTLWRPGDYLADPYQILLDAPLPPGEYHLYTGILDLTTGARVPVADADGNPVPDNVIHLHTFIQE